MGRVVEGKGVLIAGVRPEPARTVAGVHARDRAERAIAVENAADVALPIGLVFGRTVRPARGQVVQVADDRLGLAAVEGGDGVDGQLGGAVLVGDLPLTQRGPEHQRDGDSASDHGQPQPARAPLGIVFRRFLASQQNETETQQQQGRGGRNPEVRVSQPSIELIDADAAGQQTGEAVGAGGGTEQRERDGVLWMWAAQTHPGLRQAEQGEQCGEGQRDPRGLRALDQGAVVHEEIVDAVVRTLNPFQQGDSAQQCGQDCK